MDARNINQSQAYERVFDPNRCRHGVLYAERCLSCERDLRAAKKRIALAKGR